MYPGVKSQFLMPKDYLKKKFSNPILGVLNTESSGKKTKKLRKKPFYHFDPKAV